MAEWKQEILYVKRNEQGIIIGIEEKTPLGFESDKQWVQVVKPKQNSGTRIRTIGD